MLLVFSDPHIKAFQQYNTKVSGRSSRLQGILDALDYIKDYAYKNHLLTVCAGDIFDTFSYVDNDALSGAAELLNTWKNFYYIAGNHDLQTKADTYTSMDVSTHIFNVSTDCVYLDGAVITLPNGMTLTGRSWRNPRVFNDMPIIPADVFVGHQMIATKSWPKGLDVAQLAANYKLSIFGDIHKPEDMGNILIPGAPVQHSFSDEGQDRGFWVIDEDLNKQFVPIKSAKFISVPTILDTVADDGNFYRVRTPIAQLKDGKQLASNILVQTKIAHTFRTSGLHLNMADSELLTSYKTLTPYEGTDDHINTALEVLGGCVSTQAIPQNFRLTSATIRNFGSIRDTIEFTNDPGAYLISGNNGDGKTTLLEAIYWCMQGVTSKGLTGDDVVNDTALKDCYGKVVLTNPITQESVTIHRYRLDTAFGNDFYFTNTNGEIIKMDHVADTQVALNQYLGTSSELYRNLNYFTQENFAFFSSLTDAKQKDLCKLFLPLDRLEQAEDRMATKVAAAQEEATKAKNLLVQNQQTIESTTSVITDLAKAHHVYEQARTEQINQAQAASVEARTKYEAESVVHNTLCTTYDALVAAKPILDTTPFDTAKLEVVALLSEVTTLHTTNRHTYLQSRTAEDFTRSYVPEAIDNTQLTTITDQLEVAEADLRTLHATGSLNATNHGEVFTKYLGDLQDLNTRIGCMKQELVTAEANSKEVTNILQATRLKHAVCATTCGRLEIDLATINTVCITCNSPLPTAKVDELRAMATAKLVTAQAELAELVDTLACWKASEVEADKAVTKLQAKLEILNEDFHQLHADHQAQSTAQGLRNQQYSQDVDALTKKCDSLRSAKQQLLTAHTVKKDQAYATYVAQTNTLLTAEYDTPYNTERELLLHRIATIDTQKAVHEATYLNAWTAECAEHTILLNASATTLTTLHATIAEYALNITRLEAQPNPHAEQLATYRSKLDIANALLADTESEYAKHESLFAAYSYWAKAFSNQGIVSYVLDTFAQEFTALINEVLLPISNGRFYAVLSTQKQLKKSKEFREKFEFIIHVDGKKRTYNALSGGQKARVNLSTVIVLNKLFKKYFGLSYYPFGILALDELFTFLDDQGVDAVFQELQALLGETSLYVVTNKTDVKAKFTNVINVSYTEAAGTQYNVDVS